MQDITRAQVDDIEDLMLLYHSVYGNSYPIIYGTDPHAAKEMILSKKDHWYIIRDHKTKKPIASMIINIDLEMKIGQVIGLAVHPAQHKKGLGSYLLRWGCEEVFSGHSSPFSIYATTRTNSIGPQKVFIKNNFYSMGIFPNSHFLNDFETLTLFVRYQNNILENRKIVDSAPYELKAIYNVLKQNTGLAIPTEFLDRKIQKVKPIQHSKEFEKIDAPEFVYRRFSQVFQNPYDRYYPFHKPNFLVASKKTNLEIYMHVNHKDRHCALLAANTPWSSIRQQLGNLFSELRWSDISYIECLLRLDSTAAIETMLDLNFIPSAIYPAMLCDEKLSTEINELSDFILLSKSFEPLNFDGIYLEESFKPYLDQYVKIWEKQALESLEVVRGLS